VVHGLFDGLGKSEVRMRLDFVGQDDSEVVERIDSDLNGQARQTANRSVDYQEMALQLLS
jgi:hypothetical protein